MPTASWMTPAWQANRRGAYLVTDEEEQHPWLREDVGLRAASAQQAFTRAAVHLAQALHQATWGQDEITAQQRAVVQAAHSAGDLSEGLLATLHPPTG